MAPASFTAVFNSSSGIGGYDLRDDRDRAFTFLPWNQRHSNNICLYRPGTGAIFIVGRSGNEWTPVYQQGEPGSGIGGYSLNDSRDRALSLYYWGLDGPLEHIGLYRPGTGIFWILHRTSAGAWQPVYQQGDPSRSTGGSGIGGYDLTDNRDRALPVGYPSNGDAAHICLYRPGTGALYILERQTLRSTDWVPVYQQGDPGLGIAGYTLNDDRDRIFALDFHGTGELDHLCLYRPGTGIFWIVERNYPDAPTPIYKQGDPSSGTRGSGIGGYDLVDSRDRAFAYDYNGSGKMDHICLYRPGTGTFWIIGRENPAVWAPVYQQGDPGQGIGGYDLSDSRDRAFAYDYNDTGALDHICFYRPGTGKIAIVGRTSG